VRRARGIAILVAALAAIAAATAVAAAFPTTIPLPDGWRPEGVAVGKGGTLYAGSLGTGAVYAVDLRSGKGKVAVPGETGRVAVGLKADHRNRLFVAGGGTGDGYVYDARRGRTLATYDFTSSSATFVNDVVVTKDAAWFTDSQNPVLYRVGISRSGRLAATHTTLQLSGDYVHQAGQFNLNGIDATADGRQLLAIQSVTGKLFRIDPATGSTTEVAGLTLPNGDGILLQGRTLYAVQNRFNKVAVVRLAADLASGTVVREITDPRFDVPTTVASFRDRLYLPNARFTTPPAPDTTYTVVAVRR
jgi:sugar lactone lactonase YvrE